MPKSCNFLFFQRAKLLKKDNDFVYNEKITPTESLPEVKGATLVKCLPVDFDSIETSDLFIRLVSMKAHELSSLYRYNSKA